MLNPMNNEDIYKQVHLKQSEIISGWWFQPTPLKNMTSSVGMMTFPIWWKVKKSMFQTTNQWLLTIINHD